VLVVPDTGGHCRTQAKTLQQDARDRRRAAERQAVPVELLFGSQFRRANADPREDEVGVEFTDGKDIQAAGEGDQRITTLLRLTGASGFLPRRIAVSNAST
jgi:hypothetical protein